MGARKASRERTPPAEETAGTPSQGPSPAKLARLSISSQEEEAMEHQPTNYFGHIYDEDFADGDKDVDLLEKTPAEKEEPVSSLPQLPKEVLPRVCRWLPVKDLLEVGLEAKDRSRFRYRLLHAAYLRLTWLSYDAAEGKKTVKSAMELTQNAQLRQRVFLTAKRLSKNRLRKRLKDGAALLASVASERGACEEAHVYVQLALQRLYERSDPPPIKPKEHASKALAAAFLPFCVAFVQANFMQEAKDVADQAAVGRWLEVGLPMGAEAKAVCAKAVQGLAGRPTNVWGRVAAQALLLCQILEEPLELYRALRSVKEEWLWKVVEVLYLLATLLLALHRRLGLSDRLHYGLAAALRFYEEDAELPNSDKGKKKVGKEIQLTGEQRRIVHLPLESWSEGAEGKTFRVVAFAGSGKTHTLLHFVKAHPGQRFLMLMFNTAARDDAVGKYSAMRARAAEEGSQVGYVHIVNHHRFAHRYRLRVNGEVWEAGKLFGKLEELNYRDVLKYFKDEYRGPSRAVRIANETFDDMDRRLHIRKGAAGAKDRRRRERDCSQDLLGKLTVRTVEEWFNSADEELNLRHVPERAQDSGEEEEARPTADWAPVSDKDRRLALELAELYWAAMSRLRPGTDGHSLSPMTQSGLLKFVLLRGKRLSDVEELRLNASVWFPSAVAEKLEAAGGGGSARGFDAVLVDEAQDSNPAVLRWLFDQKDVHRMLVGDPAQSIYKFIGAVDALSEVERLDPACVTLPLTRSFRFGPRIGWLANAWLWEHCGQQRHLLFTNAVEGRLDGVLRGNQDVAIICSTNKEALQAAFDIVRDRPNARVRALGRLDAMKAEWLDAIHQFVLCNTNNADRLHALFPNSKEVANLGKSPKDMAGKCRMLDHTRKANLEIAEDVDEELVLRLKAAWCQQNATFTVCTAHSAKGLEFDTVILGGDFADPDYLASLPIGLSTIQQNANLVYVAMTRAKRSLHLPVFLHEFVNCKLGDEWLELRATKDSPAGELCGHCGQLTLPREASTPPLTLHRPRVALKGGPFGELHERNFVKAGALCIACAQSPLALSLRVEKRSETLEWERTGVPATTRHALHAFAS